MTLAALKQYVQESAMFRRVVEVVDFCAYREVREFDFGPASVPRRVKPAARNS